MYLQPLKKEGDVVDFGYEASARSTLFTVGFVSTSSQPSHFSRLDMSNNIVRAAYVSSKSARTAPRDQFVAGQRYMEPESVKFKVPGHSPFSVEMSRPRREAVEASGGIQGVMGKKNRVTFTEDCNGNAIQAFTVSLKRARTRSPPRNPTYPKPIEARFVQSEFHSHPSGHMAQYTAYFSVMAFDRMHTFRQLVTGATLNQIKYNGNRISGILEANGIGTFTFPGYGGHTFEIELWDHNY